MANYMAALLLLVSIATASAQFSEMCKKYDCPATTETAVLGAVDTTKRVMSSTTNWASTSKTVPATAKSKGKVEDEEDVSVDQFWKQYKTKKCPEYGVDVLKYIKEKYELYQEEQEKITKFHIWEEMGWAGTRALMDSLRMVSYPHCISIRFWKTYCEDEGVRAICQFLELGKPTLFLELLDNRITALGCEFISRSLHPKMNPTI